MSRNAMEKLSARGEGRRLRAQHGEVFVAERGAGIPVVALHAIAHGSGDYLPLAERVGSRFRLSMLDWPGHGLSAPGLRASAVAYADLLEQVVPQITDDPVVLVGNSIGGAAAIRYAAIHPERVRALVLCDPGGLAPIGPFERFAVNTLVRFFDSGARGASWFPLVFRAYYRAVLSARAAAERRKQITDACLSTSPLLAEAWRSFAEPQADLREWTPRVPVPVWLAWSASDIAIPWRASCAAAERFPRKTVTFFPGGHSPFLEAPDAFAGEFETWIRADVIRREAS